MTRPSELPARAWNAARKLASGLPLGGEAVWPGVRNDLFVAHESIYRFASGWTPGRRVLDAACGTGYGSFLLAGAGARSVAGLDRNRRRVAFAGRTFRARGLSFAVADCENLDYPASSFDLVVSSNTLEHLRGPERFLDHAARLLSANGLLLVAVPPVLSEADLAAHSSNRSHVSNLTVRDWSELFQLRGWTQRFFSHRSSRVLDFAALGESVAQTEDFHFPEEAIEDAYRSPPITVVYLLGRAR